MPPSLAATPATMPKDIKREKKREGISFFILSLSASAGFAT
jgi:hypothetical protein